MTVTNVNILFMRHSNPVSKIFPSIISIVVSFCLVALRKNFLLFHRAPFVFHDLLRLEDADANVYHLVLCARIPCVSVNLSLL